MSAVVDASVLIAAAIDNGPIGAWAEEIIAAGELLAPHLVLVETTNILRRLESAKELDPSEAAAAQRDLLRLAIDLMPFAPFAERVWSLRRNVTSYDGWYVAIAEGFDLPLATLDAKLARAPGPSCRFLTPDRRRRGS